ncbi:peptidoglycan binding domain protein [hydrothermal vent metagenome]|uniref:Peptidoglycan binding domain protein n=1 Tax=hydrothermal vent metagenome TaxID=652676 RepID=A0A3B0SM71_9ZZZZ
MKLPLWNTTLLNLLRPKQRRGQSAYARARGQVTHVLILDGTLSTLWPGYEGNAGLTYKLLEEISGTELSVYYEAGLQWHRWRGARNVILGHGLNRQIRRAYGYLCSRYRPGDRIFLFGYSRGAYAVRSLAGVIDRVGLLKHEFATVRNIKTAYRHYQCSPGSPASQEFAQAYCHKAAPIEMVGVWDTVKALGLRWPIIWRWSEAAHAFHSHVLGPSIRHGFHALALGETRVAYEPVLWDCPDGHKGVIEQVWFKGAHSDIGGQLNGFHAARPLSNIPLVWMLNKAVGCNLSLPPNWKARFETDVNAPAVGSWRGWGKIFWIRRKRRVGRDMSERLHESVKGRQIARPVTKHAV